MPDQDFSKQKLILGTHTSDNEQNYLMLAEVIGRCCARGQWHYPKGIRGGEGACPWLGFEQLHI